METNKTLANYRFLKIPAATTPLISKERARRFDRSAEKRDPRWFNKYINQPDNLLAPPQIARLDAPGRVLTGDLAPTNWTVGSWKILV
jgi:hypothetical protein